MLLYLLPEAVLVMTTCLSWLGDVVSSDVVVHGGSMPAGLNTLKLRQNGRHFADDIFNSIFLNENNCTFIEISLQYDPRGPIINMPTLVQIMAWRRPGDKPLSEPMMVSLLMHICFSRPQWVNAYGIPEMERLELTVIIAWYLSSLRNSLQWCHNVREGVSNHWCLDC